MKTGLSARLAFAAATTLAAGAVMLALPGDQADTAWREMLAQDSVNFAASMRPDGVTRPAAQNVQAVQVASSDEVVSGLLLEPGSDPQAILFDHTGAAAAIMQQTAGRMSGHAVNVIAISKPQPLGTWLWDGKSPSAQALFGHAGVLSLSMGGRMEGDQGVACGDGSLQNLADVREADSLWRSSHTVMVQSVGNEGGDGESGLQRENANLAMRSDTYLNIGEAGRGEGGTYVAGHSSRGGPSVVVTNPFREGFFYRYYGARTGEELRRQLQEFYSSRDEASGRRNRDIFAERLALPVYGENEDAHKLENGCRVLDQSRRPSLTKVHPVFSSVTFPGREALVQTPAWQAAHADEVLESFINGLVAAQEFYQAGLYRRLDAQGFASGLLGTSYAAPHAGGMIAAMREKYPQLSEYDLDAAALLAAVPVEKAETGAVDAEGGTVFRAIAYRDNGRGLMHNDDVAGFGFLTEDAYAAMTAHMAALLQKNPKLATREDLAQSAMTSFSNGGTEYRLRVNRDVTALRANLVLKFAGGNSGVPSGITLVNPAGGEVEIAPSRPLSGGVEYSFASTDGHFGNHTRGTWIISVPPGVRIEQAQLSLPGVAKNGLIDKMLNEVAGPRHDLAPVPASHSPTLALK
jgi:hypothetical protein